jgi:hypothetical protein
MLFFANIIFNPSIEDTVRGIQADGSVPNVPDTRAWAEKLVELWAAIEQHWKAITATQQKYASSHMKPCVFEVSDRV